jgi:hypothetical protein
MTTKMTLARLVPLPIHAALEVAMAPAVIAAPFALGLGGPAYVAALLIGVVMMGTGLATAASIGGPAAPQGVRVSALADVDLGIALALILTALGFAIVDEVAAAGFFAATAAAQGLLAVTTRYSARG